MDRRRKVEFIMQKTKTSNTKATIIVFTVLVVLIAGITAAYFALRPRGEEGAKTIIVEIIADGQTVDTVTISTDAAYLREALDEKALIQGDETEFGLYVKTVSGRTADESNQEWWCFTKGGEMLMTGVGDTPIEDGDTFEITLTVGYD